MYICVLKLNEKIITQWHLLEYLLLRISLDYKYTKYIRSAYFNLYSI